jgi:hypothetical protein
MPIDLTNATTLTGYINQNLPFKPWIFRKFFPVVLHDTTQIAIDIVKGSRKLAPFRRPGEESTVKNSIGVETKLFGPNQISIKNLTKAYDAAKRAAGDQLSYSDGVKTLEGRIVFKLLQEQIDMTNRIYMTAEKMCSDALFTGKVPNYDANGNLIEEFDIGLADDHVITLTGTDKWDTAAATSTAKILENIDDYCALGEDDSGLPMTDVILGKDAKNALRTNETVLKQLAANTAKFAQIDPRKTEIGAQFVGYTSTGVRLWHVTESYQNSAGQKTSMVPDDKIVCLSDQMAAHVHFGMIEDLKAGSFVGEIFSKVWDEEDPSGRWLKCAAAPLAYVEQPDAIVVAKVV